MSRFITALLIAMNLSSTVLSSSFDTMNPYSVLFLKIYSILQNCSRDQGVTLGNSDCDMSKLHVTAQERNEAFRKDGERPENPYQHPYHVLLQNLQEHDITPELDAISVENQSLSGTLQNIRQRLINGAYRERFYAIRDRLMGNRCRSLDEIAAMRRTMEACFKLLLEINEFSCNQIPFSTNNGRITACHRR